MNIELEDGEIASDDDELSILDVSMAEEREIDKVLIEVSDGIREKEASKKRESESSPRKARNRLSESSRTDHRGKRSNRRPSSRRKMTERKSHFSQGGTPHQSPIAPFHSPFAENPLPINTFPPPFVPQISPFLPQGPQYPFPSYFNPPPPPPMLPPGLVMPPQISSIMQDNYENVAMDIERRSPSYVEEADELRNRLLAEMKTNKRPLKRDTGEMTPKKVKIGGIDRKKALREEIRRMDRNIQTKEHILEKAVMEQRKLREQLKKNEETIGEYSNEMRRTIGEKRRLEEELAELQLQQVTSCLDMKFTDDAPIIKTDEPSFESSRVENEEIDDEEEEDDGTSSIGGSEDGHDEESAVSATPEAEEETARIDVVVEKEKEEVTVSVEQAMRQKLLASMMAKKNGNPARIIVNSPEDDIEKGKKLLRQMCKFDLNGICARATGSCKFAHLEGGIFDEPLLLRSILRHIYAYDDKDIDDAAVQMLGVRPKYDTFGAFIKDFMALTMDTDPKLKSRLYEFYQQ